MKCPLGTWRSVPVANNEEATCQDSPGGGIENPARDNMRKITIYRDDSTTKVIYPMVKHYFWTARQSVLSIAVIDDISTGEHHYIHWLRENICWFKDEPA